MALTAGVAALLVKVWAKSSREWRSSKVSRDLPRLPKSIRSAPNDREFGGQRRPGAAGSTVGAKG